MTDVVRELEAGLPDGSVLTDPAVMDQYRYDRAMTVVPGAPLAVVRATTTADVQHVLRVATRHRVPVVTRGAGTGLSGGSTALDGAITLSTERMRAISVDPASMVATVQPGLLNAEVKAAARQHGLWYPPDPSSFEICSIGGNLATNAGGLCCVRYGVTTDYVLGLEVVLADGRAVRLGGRTIKDVAGYDLKRLFVGSEGTLGVITEADLRLQPLPAPVATVVGTFVDVADAGRAVAATMATTRPAMLEFMDRGAVAAVERVRPMGLGDDVGAVLLAQTESRGAEHEQLARFFEEHRATFVAVTEDPDEGELLLGARRMAIPCVERLGTVLIEDIGVPITRIPELVGAIEHVASRHETAIPVIGHAGDGNFHPLVCFDRESEGAESRAMLAFDEIMEIALALGGTITGEHGVGSLKSHLLAAQLSEDGYGLNRLVKEALDPLGILNPGKWI
ncbi:MAG: FAD-binding oxidoreductase [Acidimicrobiales bacterium]